MRQLVVFLRQSDEPSKFEAPQREGADALSVFRVRATEFFGANICEIIGNS
jgi:hypothetical protein